MMWHMPHLASMQIVICGGLSECSLLAWERVKLKELCCQSQKKFENVAQKHRAKQVTSPAQPNSLGMPISPFMEVP